MKTACSAPISSTPRPTRACGVPNATPGSVTAFSDVPTAVVPHLFLNYAPRTGAMSMNGKAAWGIGVYVPYGLTSQWTDSFPGRFQAKKAALQTAWIG